MPIAMPYRPSSVQSFGEAPAVPPHRLGQAGSDSLARIVVLAVKEQHGHLERAAVRRLGRELEVSPMVHIPGIRPEEPVAGERADVGVEVFVREHVRVHREIGRLAGAAEPAAVATNLRRA